MSSIFDWHSRHELLHVWEDEDACSSSSGTDEDDAVAMWEVSSPPRMPMAPPPPRYVMRPRACARGDTDSSDASDGDEDDDGVRHTTQMRRAPVMSAFIMCALEGTHGLHYAGEAERAFYVTSWARAEARMHALCRKRTPTQVNASRIKALQRWMSDVTVAMDKPTVHILPSMRRSFDTLLRDCRGALRVCK